MVMIHYEYIFELISIEKYEYIDVEAPANDSRCFIATACYGNCDAPEVIFLRQYRNDKLLNTYLGKIIVKFYYAVSPFFAALISKSEFLKRIVRIYIIDSIIKN